MRGSKLKGELRSLDFDASGNPKSQSVTKQRLLRSVRHPDAATLALGIVIGLGVCAPLLGGHRVFLLDWSIGPHAAVATPVVLGLNGGLTSGVVPSVVMTLLNHLLGGVATWLPIMLFFPIATVGAGRLAGRSRWSRLAAGTLYAVNPFVFNRVFVGHLTLLMGYALLPFAVKAATRSLSSPVLRWCVPALWWAGLTSLSPHFAWIYGLVVLGVAVVALSTTQHPLRRVAGWFAICVGAFTLMSTYIILPNGSTNLPTQVGSVSLNLYRTNGDPHLGLFANVLALYGFWRTGPGPELPKDVIIGWPFIMFAILVIVGVGAWHALRRSPMKDEVTDSSSVPEGERRTTGRSLGSMTTSVADDVTVNQSMAVDQKRLAILLVFIGVAGYFLALGNQGPTGGLFLWAYDHVPFFSIMREPQKFLMLLALAYAVLFGWGVERLSQSDISPSRIGVVATAVVLGVALPLGYSATIFDGLAGQITSSDLPTAYQQADDVMGTGAGNVLVLPWHIYMEYPFTDGRVIANVGPTTFRRNVISGDNVQADDIQTQSTSPRSAYLEQLFNDGMKTKEFGELVRPLGVQYVVLSKTVDWPSYSFLNHQKDLKLILDNQSLEVWRNLAYEGVGQRVAKLTTVSGISGLLTLAKFNELGAGAVITSRSTKSSGSFAKNPTHVSSSTKPSVHQLSPVAYRISSGTPGWVTVDAPYQRGWSLNGRAATSTAEGTVLVRVGAKGGILEFTPWRLVRLGYIVSAGVFIALSLVLAVEPRRRKSMKGVSVHSLASPEVD